jgi:RHS repeat-associated protein
MRGNQSEKNEGTGTTKYYYDSLSRIKTVLEPGQTQNYEYDDLDNIKEMAVLKGYKVEETKYLYDNDSRLMLQETNDGIDNTQKRFTYDANGNQLTKDEVVKRNGSTVASKDWNYWYDGFNQLSRVQNPDDQFTDYTYNGNGLRTKKDFGDKSINYYYNNSNIIMETDKNNAVTAKNIRGLKLIYRESNANGKDPQYLYYLHNAHGDVTQLLNEKAEVIKDYRYDAFGQEEMPEDKVFGGKKSGELWRQEVEKIDNPFRYCGEYLDEETGNYYLRARYYDPSVQRFINEDSYAVAYGAAWKEHLYAYAGNNPINYMDPSGHFSISTSVKSIVSVVTAIAQKVVSNNTSSNSSKGTFGSNVRAAANIVINIVKSYLSNNKKTNSSSGGTNGSNSNNDKKTKTPPAPIQPVWPVVGAPIKEYTSHNPPKHVGIDISEAPGGIKGKTIVAPFDGTVVKTIQKRDKNGNFISYGEYVAIDSVINGQNCRIYFAHMLEDSTVVKEGQKIKAGEQIGKVGSTGYSSGPHLHLEIRIRVNGKDSGYLDPMNLFKK